MSAQAQPLASHNISAADPATEGILGTGWYDAEENGVWHGRASSAVLNVPAIPEDGGVLLLVCHSLIPPHYDEGAVRVTIDGEGVRVVPIGATFVCDIPESARGKALTVAIDAPTWPAEAFGRPEGTSLGFMLDRIEIHPEPVDPDLDLRNYPRHPGWEPLIDDPPDTFIRIDERGLGFEDAGGQPFVPLGCNYFDPGTGKMPPHIWSLFDEGAVEEQFALMESLGVNCARTFLAAGALLKSPYEMDEAILRNVDRMLEIAGHHGIRMMLTIADFWETGEYVHNLQPFGQTEQLFSWLGRYCQVLGKRYANESALFAWDLRNEPMVVWDEATWRPWQFREWLRSEYGDIAVLRNVWGDEAPESWESIDVPPNEEAPGGQRLYDYQRFREELARQWTEVQVAGLRAHDRNHPIGVGFIQWSFPAQRMVWDPKPAGYGAYNAEVLAPLVDFQMMHFYPMYGNPADGDRQTRENLLYAQACVEACHVGQPIILAEFGWHGGAADDPERDRKERALVDWCTSLIEATEGKVCGWLCWPFAEAPEIPDLSSTGGMVTSDLQVEPWGQAFKALAEAGGLAAQSDLSPPHGGSLTASRRELLTSLAACQRYMHEYIRARDASAGTVAGNRIEMAGPSPAIGWGFAPPEQAPEDAGGFGFQWALGEQAALSIVMPKPASVLRFRAHPHEGLGEAWVDISLNGSPLPRVLLSEGWEEYEVSLPAELVRAGERTDLHFRFPGFVAPSGGDWRTLSVAIDYLDFRE